MTDERDSQCCQQNASGQRSAAHQLRESDEAFLDRHFLSSVEALLRVGALQPGEFDELVQSATLPEEERAKLAERHDAIARLAVEAVRVGQLSEEDFNIWSGRRKERGIAVRPRFEQAYAQMINPTLARRRGALTGIVRAFQRMLDEMIDDFVQAGEQAATPEELVTLEQQAVQEGFLTFELFTFGTVAGWPSFMRSSGRLRGAMRLREYFEERQAALPMTAQQAELLLRELREGGWLPAEEGDQSGRGLDK